MMVPITVLDPDLYASGDPAANGLPFDQYAYLRDTAPIFRQNIEDPGMVQGTWIVSRYEDVVKVLKSTGTFNSRKGTTLRLLDITVPEHGGKPAMVSMEGDEHTRNRRIVSRGFTPAVVRTFERHFRELAVDIVDRAIQKQDIDFVNDIASLLPLFAICDLIGVPEPDRLQMLKWTNTFTVQSDPDYSPSPADADTAVRDIWHYGVELASKRRANPTNDLMSKIVAAVDDEQLSEDELMGFMLTLTAAGNETTRNVLSHGILALITRPDSLNWLRHRCDDIPMSAIEELLRWSSPVVYSRRDVVHDVEFHGQMMREGDATIVLYPSANFDPEQFAEPRILDLTRSPNAHVTFAVGPHVCLGAHVARLEVKILLEELLRRTREMELVGPCEYTRDATLRGVKHLPVRLVGVR